MPWSYQLILEYLHSPEKSFQPMCSRHQSCALENLKSNERPFFTVLILGLLGA